MQKCFTPQFWNIMKLCAVQGVLAMITFGMAIAFDNHAQILERKVTVDMHDVSLEKVLDEVSRMTSIQFVYSTHKLDLKQLVSITVSDVELKSFLDLFLKRLNIDYSVHEHADAITLRYVVSKPRRSHSNTPGSELDEMVRVTGRIADSRSQPIAGANIVVKGTTNGTTTDADGRYSIDLEPGSVLVFSFIGYRTIEIRVGEASVLDVTLEEDAKSLDEVVVNAGYYTTTPKTQTGSIARVEAKEIQLQPVSNPIAALQGRVPGLEVIQQNGIPGSNFKVRIRGTNSIASGNEPLYIIDGVPFTSTTMTFTENSGNILGSADPLAAQGASPLNTLNPANIESIEVLKDADATAIYGSRGANGVILITTKKGKIGQSKVNLNLYSGVANVAGRIDVLNTQQYVAMRREAFKNDNITPNAVNAPDLMIWDSTRYTNWQKELIGGNARITDMQLSLSGGERNTQFLVGSGYHKETTVFPGSNADQRFSFNSSMSNQSFAGKLKTTLAINLSNNRTSLPSQDLTFNALSLSPNAPALYDESGNLSWTNWTAGIENPLAYLKRKYEASSTNLIGNLSVSYSLLANLDARINAGYTSMTMNGVTVLPISALNPTVLTKVNQSNFSASEFNNWIAEPQLNWRPKVDSSTFDILIGTSFLNQSRKGIAQSASGYSSEALMRNLGAAPTIVSGANYESQYRYHAIFGRINYKFRDRYIINITGRRDGSSRFGEGNQFAFFGALGTAWIFSQEKFLKSSIPFLSFGKLRFSYGTSGNDQIGDYQYLDTYRSSGLYQTKLGVAPTRLSNPVFGWESNRKLEGGADLGFFNDRVWLAFSYYRNRSSSQLIGFPLAPTTGFASIQSNFPAVVQNTGVELVLTTHIIESSSISWSASLNYTIPRNSLLEFPDIKSFPSYASSYVVGEPLDIRKVYQFKGVNPTSGLYEVVDADGDGAIGVADRTIAAFIGRRSYGGLRNTLRLGSFQLDCFVQVVSQDLPSISSLYAAAPGNILGQPSYVIGRWTNSSTLSATQKFSRSGQSQAAYAAWQSSDNAITDGSFIRLKNVSLTYNLPPRLLAPIHLSQASVFAQGQNLVTLTNYKGLNPESGSGTLPALRTFTIGMNLNF